MRILVLRGGALGDFLVTLPALQLLRHKWPDARIELVGHPAAGELGVLGGLLDAVHSQHEARWGALHGDSPLAPDFAAWLGGFDLVVNYWPDPDGSLARHFPLRPNQHFVSGSPAPAIAPAARHFCEPLRALGLWTDDYRSRPRLPSAADLGLGTWDSGPATAIHPGSGSPRKNWPAERWIEVIKRLDQPMLLILGEAEREQWSALTSTRLSPGISEQRLWDKSLHLAIELPLSELAAALSRCRLFLGHDSGVSHLAAAVGVPCLLLFGPTDPAMWAPPGGHVRVIRRGESLDAIDVDEVLTTARALLV